MRSESRFNPSATIPRADAVLRVRVAINNGTLSARVMRPTGFKKPPDGSYNNPRAPSFKATRG